MSRHQFRVVRMYDVDIATSHYNLYNPTSTYGGVQRFTESVQPGRSLIVIAIVCESRAPSGRFMTRWACELWPFTARMV